MAQNEREEERNAKIRKDSSVRYHPCHLCFSILSLFLSFPVPVRMVGARSFFARFSVTTQMPWTCFLRSPLILRFAPSRFLYYLRIGGSFASLVTQSPVSMGYIYRVCFAFHTPIVSSRLAFSLSGTSQFLPPPPPPVCSFFYNRCACMSAVVAVCHRCC